MRIWRPATSDDIPPLEALIESAYRGDASRAGWTTEADLLGGNRISQAMLADTLADVDQHMLVCEDDAAGLIACVTLQKRPGYGYIGTVSVRPTLQGGGLGREVLAQAEKWLRETWQLPLARMTVIAQRPELIAWYQRRGYHDTGETAPFPYGDTRFGAPKRDDLYFCVLEKRLAA
ncbi:MAG: GNAT family N-acetyltransferase [Alphaproteobacteria bacterium]|nr:GNAT family N-acetyltransferase [Alphaproteobacteria bacterium]